MAKRILIVDDEPNIVRLIRVNLERVGFEVDTASNGQQALDRLAGEPLIDLIVTDVMMPVMYGFELFERARQIPAHASVPFIIMGALPEDIGPFDSPEAAAWLRKASCQLDPGGAVRYMVKPFNPAEVVQMVQTLLATPQPLHLKIADG